jgi:hypothetical protein
MENNQISLKAQCQIIWFPWEIEDITDHQMSDEEIDDYTLLSDSGMKDISNHLKSNFTFTKSRGSPAGNFNFDLAATRDWKSIIKPGHWMLVCISNEGDLTLPEDESDGDRVFSLPNFKIENFKKDKLRAILYVERVTSNTTTSEKGTVITYEVSGKDFGVVYEDTVIWYNQFLQETLGLNALYDIVKFSFSDSIDNLLSVMHDLFLAPNRLIPDSDEKSRVLGEASKQWLLPNKLVTLLKLPLRGEFSFWGNIDSLKRFSPSISTLPILDVLGYINGNMWEKLKQYSVKELHELFTELDNEGNPNLIFRPIPWGINSGLYPDIVKILDQKNQNLTAAEKPYKQAILGYKNFSEVEVEGAKINTINLPEIYIIGSNVGEDEANRYNHFFADSNVFLGQPISSIAVLNEIAKGPNNLKYPYPSRASIRRHGFKPMHVQLDALGQFSEKNDQQIPEDILYQANDLMRDYWENAIYFESGSFTIIGRNDIRVGKVLDVSEEAVEVGGKLYYIEGYTDRVSVNEGITTWIQNLIVTRGIEKVDLNALTTTSDGASVSDDFSSGFASRDTEFKKKATFYKIKGGKK